ncbi:MAG: clostripain-related cysteine peptidase [Anaerolineae bacterium]
MKRIAAMLILAVSVLLTQGAFAQSVDNWTILHYTAVDNNLEGDAFNDYYEMQSAGSGSGVNIVTEFDRAEGFDNRFGDWTGTRRFHIEHVDPLPDLDITGMRAAIVDFLVQAGEGTAEALRPQVDALPDEFVSRFYTNRVGVTFDQTPVEDLGEVDMGDPQSLADFIVWGVQNYPANHYMIVIGSHGGGWRGIGPDQGQGTSMLDLPEIDAALTQAQLVLGIEKFDIVGFDACLMGVTDVAVMLESHADYVLSSQEVIPSSGWEYRNAITAMQANPDWDAFQVGAAFIDSYMEYYAGPGARSKVGLSLVQTDQLPALLDSLQNFAQVVGADTVELLSALGTARNNSQAFGTSLGDRADVYSYVDLRDFMTWFSLQTTITDAAYNAAQEVIAAFDSAVVYSRADGKLPRANGLGVYLPRTPIIYTTYGEQYPADAPAGFAFWQGYLNQFYTTITNQLDGSALQIDISSIFTMNTQASVLDNPVVMFDASGLGVIDLTYTITYLLQNGSRIIVDTAPIAYTSVLPTGEEIIEYPNELTPSTFTWSAEVPILTDGTNRVLGLAQSSSASGGEAYIQGTYVSAAGSLPAYLVFDNADYSYIGLLAVTDESPAEVTPNPGDQFIVDLITISADGEVARNPLADSPLTFGTQPFTLSYELADSGSYEIGLRMSDLAGNVTYRSTQVEIDNSGADGTLRGYTDISTGIYFQYPREWGEGLTLANDDGSLTTSVSNQSGDRAIFVDSYSEIDAQTALDNAMQTFDVEYGDVNEITFGGMPALSVDYVSSSDEGPMTGTLVSVFNEQANAAVLFTVQTSGDAGPTIADLLGLLDQSLLLFSPA